MVLPTWSCFFTPRVFCKAYTYTYSLFRQRCDFHYICVGLSATPQNVTTVVINSTSISVSWYPPSFLDQNDDIIGYQLMITNQNRTNSQPTFVNVTNVTTYVAIMLQEFEVYSIAIAAETGIGLGPFSKPVSDQTFEDG